MAEINLVDFFAHYTGGPANPQQEEAVRLLEEDMPASLLTSKARWVRKYRETAPAPEFTPFTPHSPYTTLITPHFTYAELTLNEPARRFTDQGQCDIAAEICQFLEKARAKFGPLKITSGHRPPAVNAAVGGASNSEHLYKPGCGAVDVYPINGDGMAFEKWCDEQWPFSVGYGMAYRGFVHLGIREGRPRVRWDY